MSKGSLSDNLLNALLNEVEKPGRYIGNEVNMIRKNPADVRLKVALVFPDVYEMGESHVGLKILYQILNAQPDIWAERVYAPWPDMEETLIRHQVSLFSLESKRPLVDFDLIGITLPYELVYTNILTILDRGGIPLWRENRDESHPLIIAGGSCAFNPEPIADFLDGVVIGDGEELILEIARQVLHAKENKIPRVEMLKGLTRQEGIYIPQFFEVDYQEDGLIREIRPKFPEYHEVKKATVTDLDGAPYPTAPIVPNIEVIHDRIGVEVQRGCVRACRFCQAGYIYRPERQRSPDTVKQIIEKSLSNTGQEEISLLSLSIGDYACLSPLLGELFDRYEKRSIAISLPATRTETLTPEIIGQIKRVRKTGFTLAPEAGTPRMRRLINKGNSREDLMRTVDNVYREGWRLIKFYYMCGLPLEEESDLLGIAEEAKQALAIGKSYVRHPEINVSVSSFVPKPFTPFQWEPQHSISEIEEKHSLLRRHLKTRGLNFKTHHVEMSYLEGVFSRGDRRLSRALFRAYQLGCRFDEWDEKLNFQAWLQAFHDTRIDPDFYVTRRRAKDEILPWDHLFAQMKKDFLWEELQAAHDLAFIEDCSTHRCSDCGVCDFRKIRNVNFQFLSDSGEVKAFSTRGRPLKEVPSQKLASSSAESGVVYEQSKTYLKIRAQFTKLGHAAFLSHLDLATVIRRSLARAKIPVGFSQGFHPTMLLSLGPALAVGMESEAEWLDVEVTQSFTAEEFVMRMNSVLPEGICILRAEVLPTGTASINATLREQSYRIDLNSDKESVDISDSLQERVCAFNNSSEVHIERRRAHKTQRVDIRPYIKDLKVVAPNHLHLVTRFGQTSGSIRPTDVLSALFPEGKGYWRHSRIRKVEVCFENFVARS